MNTLGKGDRGLLNEINLMFTRINFYHLSRWDDLCLLLLLSWCFFLRLRSSFFRLCSSFSFRFCARNNLRRLRSSFSSPEPIPISPALDDDDCSLLLFFCAAGGGGGANKS